MKLPKTLSLLMLAAAVSLTGCGGDNTAAPAAAQASAGPVVITGNDQMQFSLKRFEVTAGQEVNVLLRNVGRMPKAAMGHNIVFLAPGTDLTAFALASAPHPATDYVAPDFRDRVLAASRVLGPGESVTLTFTAPSAPGEYPYVCSFPGHTQVGMVGTMVVK
jgi:azurin